MAYISYFWLSEIYETTFNVNAMYGNFGICQ